MANKYQDLSNLRCGSHSFKIKVRIIRFWRGMTNAGEDFKGFNIMLLDAKGNAMHAFIPAKCAYDMERKLRVGTINIITNFTVQTYKDKDKFRCLRNNIQMVFTQDTTIQQIEEKGTVIAQEAFDFYDHSELMELTKQTTYLADVIGVIRDREIILANITNRHGKAQQQAKFTITDGRSDVNITLWDKFAQEFVKAIWENLESPVIIIIANSRPMIYNGGLVLTHVASTKYYLNYNHHSVHQIRNMLKNPDYAQQIQVTKVRKPAELFTVLQIKSLTQEYIGLQVIAHVNITNINEKEPWFFVACTSCDCAIDMENGFFRCQYCARVVAHGEMRYRLHVVAYDRTGSIDIILHDREVRTLIGYRAREILPEGAPIGFFPDHLRQFGGKPFTIMLEIGEENVKNNITLYSATNICIGFKLDNTVEIMQAEPPTAPSTSCPTEATTSNYNIEGMSKDNTNMDN